MKMKGDHKIKGAGRLSGTRFQTPDPDHGIGMDPTTHRHANVKLIEESHRDVYARLYRTCPTVTTGPMPLRWSPTYAVGPGGIGISSKLPFRMHVGIEPQTSGGLRWGEISFYHPEADAFVAINHSHAPPLLLTLLESWAKQYGKPAHARIWGLSEIPAYRGLNVDQAWTGPLAIAWLLHLDVITAADVAAFVRAPTTDLMHLRGFPEVWRLAVEIESVLLSWVADGDLAVATILDSRYPLLFFRERDPILFDRYRDLGIEHPASYYRTAENLFFRAVRMEELFALDQFPVWPIDIALLYIGEEGDSRSVYKSRSAYADRLGEAAAFTRAHLAALIPETFRESPRFLELAQESPQLAAGMQMYRTYREVAVTHSMTVLHTMHDLFRYGSEPHRLYEFFHAQNICQYILCMLGLSLTAIGRPRKILRLTSARQQPETGSAARLIGPGLHGCLMVLAAQNTLEPILDEAVPLIREETGKSVHCHYASWCDGAPVEEGARITQHLASGLRSAYVNGSTVTVRVHEHGQPTGVLLHSDEQWEHERATYDVALDQRENRIYVRGAPLDSSELHTTKQTIELLRKLLGDARKHTFTPNDLPPSSYREDRNQLESKVVRPFTSAIERRTGHPFGLRVTGGLRKDYTLLFTPTNHRIAWVEHV